jgi:hypothetical protein
MDTWAQTQSGKMDDFASGDKDMNTRVSHISPGGYEIRIFQMAISRFFAVAIRSKF